MSTGKASLLGLPRELRDIIYPYVFPTRLFLVNPMRGKPFAALATAFICKHGIFFTNRQLRTEAIAALARLLSTSIIPITASEDALMPPLQAQWYTSVRDKIQTLKSLVLFQREGLVGFSLSYLSGWLGQDVLTLVQHFPNLNTVWLWIRWHGLHEAIVLDGIRAAALAEIEKVVVGNTGEELRKNGWVIEYHVVDPTRWRAEWSAVISYRKGESLRN